MSKQSVDVSMLRLVEEVRHQAFVMAQDYQTREIMLFVAGRQVLVHSDGEVVRAWLRHYGNCGCYGRRCFVDGHYVCSCVPGVGMTL